MGLTKGNRSDSILTTEWNADSYKSYREVTKTHNANGDFLLVVFTNAGSQYIDVATFNGTPMTKLGQHYFPGYDQTQTFYGLANPDQGNYTLYGHITAVQYNGTDCVSMSFDGCSGYRNLTFNNKSVAPHSDSTTVLDNSILYATAISTFVTSSIEFDGTPATPLMPNNVNVNDIIAGAWSNNLNAGSINVETNIANGDVTNTHIEILEASTSTAPSLSTTTDASNIDSNEFDSGGIVTSDGGETITEVGVCYSTSSIPTTSHYTKVGSPTAVGTFTALDIPYGTYYSPGTTIYYRAYAINSIGIGYGPIKSFVAPVSRRRVMIVS